MVNENYSGIKQQTVEPNKFELKPDECTTHLCFEFISYDILYILYPYSCKTHKISSKLGFVGLLMKSK